MNGSLLMGERHDRCMFNEDTCAGTLDMSSGLGNGHHTDAHLSGITEEEVRLHLTFHRDAQGLHHFMSYLST